MSFQLAHTLAALFTGSPALEPQEAGLLMRASAEEDAGAAVLRLDQGGLRHDADLHRPTRMPLHKARPGSLVEILDVRPEGDEAIVRRLQALGFVPGTRVEVRRRAPLGDPTEYALRGARISLRKREAALIHVCWLDG